ncbi:MULTISPECIES: hypothetical protein [unclassified Flavobacterium]|uniref:hypothetical protein n=1 Tax=unclassified Flavobacterium TaxID=196869 RepID=UPI001290C5AF|nr:MULTISPECIES: hypothetical protein [unclassified Flavobacterium]MQP62266.1 hypothetical protein [Flavobacterium sp. LMO6]
MNLKIGIQMKIKLIVSICFISIFGFGQSHKGNIERVEEKGFHRILIAPEVRSASYENFDFLRIYNDEKKEIPFVVDFNKDYFFSNRYQSLRISDQKQFKDSVSYYIINVVQNMKYCSELSLKIANTGLTKEYNISGSDDGIHWFGLVMNAMLYDLNDFQNTYVRKTVSFPNNSYKFLKIEFIDKNSMPVNLLEVGYFIGDEKIEPTTVLEVFKHKLIEDKTNKKTIIKFSADNLYTVDGIAFNFKNSRFFRKASVFIKETRSVKKKSEIYRKLVATFNLDSNSANSFKWESFQAKDFEIEIENLDNEPLEIKGIKLLQNQFYLIADLDVSKNYEIVVDSTLSKPQYDLVKFLPNDLTKLGLIRISDFKKISLNKATITQQFWQTNWFLWIAIVVAGIIIGYFAFGLLKEVEKKD